MCPDRKICNYLLDIFKYIGVFILCDPQPDDYSVHLFDSDIYEQKFTEHCKLIQWLTFDNLVERCKSAMEQGDEDLMMDLNEL